MLSGNKIALRAWSADDIAPLSAMRNDVELQKLLMTQPKPNSNEQVARWLSDKSSRENGVFFVVAELVGGSAVGYVQVVDMDFLHGTGKLGICLARDSQGKGYGYEVLHLLEGYLQETFHLRKIILHVLANNGAAIGLYRRAGFIDVGCMREHFYLDGAFQDVLVMEKILPK
ncbi:GNAT family N-acetyltransferase [Mariprofundus ferrooxydans]|uniref:GNAT family N-acetyltransferase n=1 Tax=Mariprofundus ferrooxydans TaxID=314344 RepID=UPI0014304E2F|nr:GNAT family protein [Mariprofundus ferrooxydans]